MLGFIVVSAAILIFFLAIALFASSVLKWQRIVDEYASAYIKRSERRAVYIKDNYIDEGLHLLSDEVISISSIYERKEKDDELSIAVSGFKNPVLNGFADELEGYFTSFTSALEAYRIKCSKWYNRVFCSILNLDRRGYIGL